MTVTSEVVVTAVENEPLEDNVHESALVDDREPKRLKA